MFKLINKLFAYKYFRFLFISIPAIIFFVKILRNEPFFAWDDFDHLRLVSSTSYFEILQIVLSKSGIWVNHHIILGFWLFKFIFDLFRTNIYPYITVVFILNLISVFAFYVLSSKFINNNFIKTITSFFFGLLYLGWISNIHELLGAIFLMFSLYLFIEWANKKTTIFGVLAILFYVLGFFSKEIVFLLFPIMSLIYLYTQKGKTFKNDLKIIIPISLIFISYSVFYASTFLGYFGQSSGYNMNINIWTLFTNLGYYLKLAFPGMVPFFGLTVLAFAFFYIYSIYKKEYWPVILLSGFFAFILPALLFSNRVSSYYLYIPAIFLFLSLAKLYEYVYKMIVRSGFKKLNKNLIYITLILVTAWSFFGLNKELKDNIYLIFYPWPNQTRKEFLVDIKNIMKFEEGELLSTKLVLNNKSREIVETSGAEVVKPFLNKNRSNMYEYTYDNINQTLLITKK